MNGVAVAHRAKTAYQSCQVEADDPMGLVVKLYDGLLGFVRQAWEALESGAPQRASEPIRRASDIVGELQAVLDLERGGEIATNLDRLYGYVRKRLVESHLRADSAGLLEVTRLLAPLRDAWREAQTIQAR